MTTKHALKEEARRHEQKDEWLKALQLYLRVIEMQAEGEEPDIALHNRVGDLRIRLGDVEGAVESYENAIQLYLDAELPNNAVAMCRKIVRNAPTVPSPYLRMGQIRAAQGFVVDARENFLVYAELQEGLGNTEEALRSLAQFVELVPEEVETRIFLAEQQLALGQQEVALGHLVEAHRVLNARGETGRAVGVLERIHELQPDLPISGAELEVPEVAPEDEGDDGLAELESTSRDAGPGLEIPEGEQEEEFEGPLDFEDFGLEVKEPEKAKDDDTLDLSEINLGAVEDATEEVVSGGYPPDGDSGDEMLDLTPIPHDDDLPEDAFELPLLHFDGEDAGGPDESEEDEHETVSFDEVDLGVDEELDSGVDEAREPGVVEELEPGAVEELEPGVIEELDLGVIDELEPGVEEMETSVDELRRRVTDDNRDAVGWRMLGQALIARGDIEEGCEALDRAHAAYAGDGKPDEALEVARDILQHDATRIELRQRVVEYAYQTNDRGRLVEAFLELAGGLLEAGEPVKAEAVCRQVLTLDPENREARRVLNVAPTSMESSGTDLEAGRTSKTPTEATERDDYVDLGALVLGEDREVGTRWVVSADKPSGDEAADFARMLAQFKEKVAQNLASDDATAHYDLGMAYKEMGLLEEAIGRFQDALRAAPQKLGTYEMLGQCFLDQGEPQAAVHSLTRGLELQTQVEDDLLGVYYILARAHEELGHDDSAKELYGKVFSLDINFKDVTERLRALR